MLRRRLAPSFYIPDRVVAGILSIALVGLSVAALAPSLGSSENAVEPTPGPSAPRPYVEGVLGRATNASPFGARSAADRALVALLPILPGKAAAGLAQLGVDVTGKTLTQLLQSDLPVGQKLGEGQPLFPKLEPKI